MNKPIAIAVVTLLTLAGGSATAQIVYGQPASISMRVDYTSWDIDSAGATEKVSQVFFPMRAFVPMAENTEMLLYVSGASSSYEPSTESESYDLAGVGDARLQFNRSLAEDRFLVSLGLSVPTGKKKLALTDEAQVLSALARNYLSLPSRRMGEGLGVNLLLGGAQMLGEIRARAGLSYQYNGKYEPYDGITDFDPGDAISIQAGLERPNEKSILYADFAFTLFTKDKLDGTEVFKQSTQLSLGAGANFDIDDVSRFKASVSYLVRGRNSTYLPDEESESKLYGNEFLGKASYHRVLAEVWSVAPSVEFRSIAANEAELEAASIVGLGLAVGRRMSDAIGLTAGGKYYTGSADGGDLDLSGLNFSFGLTVNP